MTFEHDKKSVLNKEDKSSKSSIDARISRCCDLINRRDAYYTTSSCSGRIVLCHWDDSSRKKSFRWLFVSHDIVDVNDISNALNNNAAKTKEIVLKCEPFILHVNCRTLDDAKRLIEISRIVGAKRSGVISFSAKIIVEIVGIDELEMPLVCEGKQMIPDERLTDVIYYSNKKLLMNFERIKKLEKELEKI